MSLVTKAVTLAQNGATREQIARALGVGIAVVDVILDGAVRLGLGAVAQLRLAGARGRGCTGCVPDAVICAGCPLASAKHENIPL